MAVRGAFRTRPLLALVAWCALVAGLLVHVPSATAASSPSLSASPAQGIAGEPLALKGGLGTKVARKVQLQSKQGSRWSTVASARSTTKGKFSFALTFPSSSASYRVKAPRATIKRTTYAAVTTPARTVTVQPQTATLALPATGELDDFVQADGAFTPARPGRDVRLEQKSGSSWQLVDEDEESTNGEVSFDVDLDDTGTLTYRLVAGAAGGAAEVSSAPRSIVVQDANTDTTPPGPVTGLSVTGTTSSGVSLSWTNPADADFAGVMVRRAVGATAPASPSAGTLVADVVKPGTSVTDTGLAASTQYSYAVFAHDGVPNYATARTVTTSTTALSDTTPPGPVTGLSVTDKTSSSVTLSWTNPGDADLVGVMVRRSAGAMPPASPTAGTLVTDVAKPGLTVTDSGLSASTQYSYAVFAHDGVPNFATGATVTTTTLAPSDTTPPGPVTGLSVTGTTSSGVSLSWTNPADADFAGVMVRRAVGATAPASPSAGTLVADVVKPGTSVTDTGLAASTQYSYAVFAHDGVPNYATAKTATAATAGTGTKGDWSQSRYDPEHRSWSQSETVITPGNAASVNEEWTTTAGSPAVVGTTLYNLTTDPMDNHGVLAAHDLATGSLLWSVSTDTCTSGPLSVTATAIVLGCSQPRAYALTGAHELLWNIADTDPGQFFSNVLVIGERVVAWGSAVASYQLSDGQRVWQQVMPSGANSISDVAASGGTVVVAYDDRLRGLSGSNGAQLWSTPGVWSSQLVIAGGFVYTNADFGVSRYSLATGAADGWTLPDGSNIYAIEAADADTVYVWEAVFDFGPPSPSVLHALRASDGSQRWQSDVPSRVGAVAVAGDVVWLTSSEIFSQGRNSDLIALDRLTGAELRHLSWDDNNYGHANVSFADGKVVINQGGSAGSSPGRLRVLGLAGPRPTVTTPVLPLGRTGQSYSATLQATGVAPITWAADSGSLPAGLSLSAGGAITGTPTSPGTSRFVVRATAANGRSVTRSLPLQVVTSGTPSWTTTARDATRNAFEPGTGQLDLSAAPSIAFRWKTAPPGPTQFGNDQDVALSGTTLYTVGWDGVLEAFDTTGSQANRTPLWTALPSAGTGQGYTGAPTVSGSRIFVLDTDGRLHGVNASTGADLWHTDPVSGGWTAPLVVGSAVFIRDNTTSFRGYGVSDGTPLWGGNPTTATDVISSLSSDGSRIYALTGGCEVVAVDVGTGAVVWHVPIRVAPRDQCVAGFAAAPPTPMVVGGKVYATEPAGRAVLEAATGAVDLRFGVYGSGESSGVLVGGLWCFESDSHILAVDTTTGELAWRSTDAVGDFAQLSSTGDLLLVASQSQVTGVSRLTGEIVVDVGALQGVGGVPAIGTNRFFLTARDGTRAYGPLS